MQLLIYSFCDLFRLISTRVVFKNKNITTIIYVTGKLYNQAFREMPKNFSLFLK